jgi:phage baseplate assembly protein W
MANLKKIYSDIDFTFTKIPVLNDVALSYDEMAVIRSIRNLLLTNHFERPFAPEIGSNINGLLFEPISPITSSSLETEIKNVIQNFEPRALLKTVNVIPNSDKNAYSVDLTFYIQNATLPTTVTILLERNR